MSIAQQQYSNLAMQNFDVVGSLALTGQTNTDTAQELDGALRLSGMLQTTLDLNQIIEIFAVEAGRLVEFSHIEYSLAERDINIRIGNKLAQSCVYRLVVAGQTLGELQFSRRKKFSAEENAELESLLCGLVYPLRNALLYQSALEAAHKDPLTGVNNRSSMDATINREIDLAQRHNRELSLLALDIDHFKKINDTYGHSMGDCVIKAIAEASAAAIRSSDMVFRFGGEEFVILLNSTDRDGALLLADRLRQRIEETIIICDGTHVSATVSIGLTCLRDGDDRESLFSRADSALYQAKDSGRNCCREYGE